MTALLLLWFLGWSGAGRAAPPEPREALKAKPVLEAPLGGAFEFDGPLGERLRANEEGWLLAAPKTNPAMLRMFRDRASARALVAWAGEFAGKYLTAAALALPLGKGGRLRAHLGRFTAELLRTQDQNGYLGPFPREKRMTGAGLWDLWGQYHVALGLYEWYRETGDRSALAACTRWADYLCGFFLDSGRRTREAGQEEANQAPIHLLALLYEETGEPRYLRMAREIEQDWETPPAGDYVRTALAGKPFHQTPKPRWESLHGVQAVAELYFITGKEDYRKAFEHIWWSLLEGDRHDTGGFSSGEKAVGDPYDPRPIETCATVAWMAVTLDYLRMTGDSRAADELELSTWNAVLGAQHPTGRWWTYNTPMDGVRNAATRELGASQGKAGGPELNCCSVNGPRGLGALSRWSVMRSTDGIAVNAFGPGRSLVRLPSGRRVRLVQRTEYPVDGAVKLAVHPEASERFALRLRIPGWSRATSVRINGTPVPGVRPGAYLVLERSWKDGDEVDIAFDMSPRLWVGEGWTADKVAVYRGPLLLAYDARFDGRDPKSLAPLDLAALGRAEAAAPKGRYTEPDPILLLRFPTADGKAVTLCDFASAGSAGTPYVSWLPVRGARPARFSREAPLRAVWPGP
ncbi:MAG: glycoside hydrolase family 127 protein [Elusimicrobia bacterium]|nr:glycoside hydrolase family 127 protein [Elusimicrobiota bacterium]